MAIFKTVGADAKRADKITRFLIRSVLAAAGLLFFCLNSFAQKNESAAALESAARLLSAQIAEKPQNLPGLFDKNFFHRISLEKLSDILSGIYKSNGRVTAVRLERADSAFSAHFIFETENNFELPAALSLDPDTGKISGVFFTTAYKKNLLLQEFKEKLVRLEGKTGFILRRFGVPSPTGGAEGELAGVNENGYFAVGSAFKLYVLGALLEKGVRWKTIVHLREEQKSLPGGRPSATTALADKLPAGDVWRAPKADGPAGGLAGWPDASPLTAHTLSVMMISESDNTAADLLIETIGRKTLEGYLQKFGHSNPALMRPFLKTSEMFRLKSDTESVLKYLNLPPGDKYGFLSELAAAPLKAEAVKKSSFGIDKIEWMASPADLCRLMEYIYKKDDKQALDILAMSPPPVGLRLTGGGVNTGLDMETGNFFYAGYKGGSEPGVLNMTWLLKSKSNAWYCLSASWNNEKKNLDENKFFELVQSVLRAGWE